MSVGPLDPEERPDGGEGPSDGGAPVEAGRGPGGTGWLLVAGLLLWPVLAAGFVVRMELPLLDAVYLAFLLELMPVLAVAQLPLLEQALAIDRMDAYRSTALMLAVLGAVGVWLGRSTVGLDAMGLALPEPGPFLAWTAGLCAYGAVLVGAFHVVTRVLDVRETELLRHLLPRTGREKAAFTGLSVAAGAGEEIAFRGYAVPVLAPLLGGPWEAVAFTSVAFGLLHAYQGPVGMVRTGLLGAGLAAAFVLSGSLWPAMAAHLLLNLAGGLWLGERYMEA